MPCTQNEMQIQSAFGTSPGDLKYLTLKEKVDCLPMENGEYTKDWPVWQAQVEVDPLYKNDLM